MLPACLLLLSSLQVAALIPEPRLFLPSKPIYAEATQLSLMQIWFNVLGTKARQDKEFTTGNLFQR